MGNPMLPMAMFAMNVMFAAVDLAEIARTNIPLADELLSKAMELMANGSVRGPTPSHIYPIGEVEKAFRFMQSGKHTGRIMLARTENALVTVRWYILSYAYKTKAIDRNASSTRARGPSMPMRLM